MVEEKKIDDRLIITAVALYFTYFIHGIGVSILAQYKAEFAEVWGGNLGTVIQVSAYMGLGRLISYPVAGPFSDRFGRRITGLIGIAFYTAFFLGIARVETGRMAYIFGVLGGVANSFLDTSAIPAILEIFEDKGDMANMFTKFSMSLGQFVLPFAIGYVASRKMDHRTLFYLAAALLILDGILLAFLDFPREEKTSKQGVKKEGMDFNLPSIALILIGFTCTSTFVLWLNCNQELSLLYGVADPTRIQSLYALGTVSAILFSSFFMLRRFQAVDVLVIYPFISFLTLLAVYFIRTAFMVKLAGFLIGFSAAGGVLQLVTSTANHMFPDKKGTITSIVMIASSLANYIVLALAGRLTDTGGNQGPIKVIVLNIVITFIGVLLAIYVNKKFKEKV